MRTRTFSTVERILCMTCASNNGKLFCVSATVYCYKLQKCNNNIFACANTHRLADSSSCRISFRKFIAWKWHESTFENEIHKPVSGQAHGLTWQFANRVTQRGNLISAASLIGLNLKCWLQRHILFLCGYKYDLSREFTEEDKPQLHHQVNWWQWLSWQTWQPGGTLSTP